MGGVGLISTPRFDKVKMIVRQKILWWGASCERPLCLVPPLRHHQLLAQQRSCQVSPWDKKTLSEKKIPRKIYINGELNYEFTTEYIPEVGAIRMRRFLRNQVGWNVGHNLTIGGRELEYSGTHLKGIVTDVQVLSLISITVSKQTFHRLFQELSAWRRL